MEFEIRNTTLKKYYPIKGKAEVVIPEGITEIRYRAFELCWGVKSISIPTSVTGICKGAFSRCGSLISIIVNQGNQTYFSQDGILYNKKRKALIYVPDAKSGEIVISDRITGIGSEAFSNCTMVTGIVIPASVTYISIGAFVSCRNLKSITVSAGNEKYSSINGILYNKQDRSIVSVPSAIKGEISISQSVTGICNFAFAQCDKLTRINLPDSVTRIGNYAFFGCRGLTSIIIPASVTEIGCSAFHFCFGLTSITVLRNSAVKLTNSGVFDNDRLKELFIPLDSLSKLRNKQIALMVYNTILCNIDNYLDYPRDTLVVALKKRKRELSEWLVSINSEKITVLLSLLKFSLDDVVRLLALASEKKATLCKAYLLEYKNNNFNKDAIEQEMTRRTNVALGISEPTVTDIRKLWKLKRNVEYSNKYELYHYKGTEEFVIIPSSISGVEVAVVSDVNSSTVRKVFISNGIQRIEKNAFQNCKHLKEIVIPDSVTGIGCYAFSGCKGLRINCIAATKPDQWNDNWLANCHANVVWGYKKNNCNN